MFLVRTATADDVPTLLKLAKTVHFINLPANLEILRAKILRSRKSFAGDVDDPGQREFVFVLEDTPTGNVVGTSSVISCVSRPGRPHTYLQVRKREHYSTDLQVGVGAVTEALHRMFEEGVIAFYCGRGPYHIRFLPPVGVMDPARWDEVFTIVEAALEKTARG